MLGVNIYKIFSISVGIKLGLALGLFIWCSSDKAVFSLSFFFFLLSLSSDEQLQLRVSLVSSLVAINLHG